MRINAYDEDYLFDAQRNLGNMMDFAVNTCDLDAQTFFDMFLVSGIAYKFGKGNPTYVAGMTGCEIARNVCEIQGVDIDDIEDVMYMDKSPEYWCGWALAYYQWYCGKTFSYITRAVPVNEILRMYPALHEADIKKFVEVMDEKKKDYYKETNLKRIRGYTGYSQSELAKRSGVNIRQIQLLEQRQRDINKSNVESVVRLARTLGCEVEDLIE